MKTVGNWNDVVAGAVRWRLAIDHYIKSQGYKIGTLVAFSGEVNDALIPIPSKAS